PTAVAVTATDDQVAVEVHDHDAGHRHRAHDVGPDEPARVRAALDYSHSSPSIAVRVSGRCRSTHSPSRGHGCPAGTIPIDVCMWGGSTSATRVRSKWNGLLSPGSSATPLAEPAPIITNVP